MKQGRASPEGPGGRKREPIVHAVDVDAVSDLGRETDPLYKGRGYEAPKASATTHNSGSQGKH